MPGRAARVEDCSLGDVRVGGRNNVLITGRDDYPVVMLANGFGRDQNMWRLVAPSLAGTDWSLLSVRARS